MNQCRDVMSRVANESMPRCDVSIGTRTGAARGAQLGPLSTRAPLTTGARCSNQYNKNKMKIILKRTGIPL